jgi:hypothetical protein
MKPVSSDQMDLAIFDVLQGKFAAGEQRDALNRARQELARAHSTTNLNRNAIATLTAEIKKLEDAAASAELEKHAVSGFSHRDTQNADLLAFFHDRLKVFLKDQGIRHDVIDACLAMPGNDDLTLLVNRATALAAFLKTEDGPNLLQGYKRANTILSQAEAKDGVEYSFGADIKFAETDEERALFNALDQAEAEFQLSFKFKLWEDIFGGASALWLGYTQRSFWQVYNEDLSRPFRETNYEPELIWTIPTVGLFITSFRPQIDAIRTGWWTVWQDPEFTLANYEAALFGGSTNLSEYFVNSLVITIPAVIIPISIACMAASMRSRSETMSATRCSISPRYCRASRPAICFAVSRW